MNISDIRIRLIETKSTLKAIATITIDGCFVVHDIKLMQGVSAPFIVMPNRKDSSGKYKDLAHPLNTQTRDFIRDEIIKAYKEAKQKAEQK